MYNITCYWWCTHLLCKCHVHQLWKCHPMCSDLCAAVFALHCVPWMWKIRPPVCLVSFSVFIAVSLLIVSLHVFLTSYTLCTSLPPHVLFEIFFLAFFIPLLWLISVSPASLPPSIIACWTGTNEPFLRNNAITSMDACACVCVCVYVTHSDCGHRLFLGENTDAAFCYCSCFRLWFVLLMLW